MIRACSRSSFTRVSRAASIGRASYAAMEPAFGSAAPLRLGVEEELLLVDADTLALAHVATTVLPRVRLTEGEVKYDVYEALVESASPVCDDAAGAAASLGAIRAAVREAGATLIGCGIHPDGALGDVVHVDADRYRAIAEDRKSVV